MRSEKPQKITRGNFYGYAHYRIYLVCVRILEQILRNLGRLTAPSLAGHQHNLRVIQAVTSFKKSCRVCG